MTFAEYQILARRTQNDELDPVYKLWHALHGIAAESGEIHSIFQKSYQGHDIDLEELIGEMGDLMWFLSELADCIGLGLESVASFNIDKLIRRYPEGFSEEKSVNREV
jgi:NTP pyrophosphatase (non-canonical NTP hydrolase)